MHGNGADNKSVENQAVTEAMASMLDKLTKAGWVVQGSYLRGEHMKVRFTDVGRDKLKAISKLLPKADDAPATSFEIEKISKPASGLMPEEARPKTNAELISLIILCEEAVKD